MELRRELDWGEDWPLVGRAAELDHVASLYRRRGHGVVLVGAPGAGKTRLGFECLQVVESLGAAPVRCTATRATSALPFGAFVALLGPLPHRGGGRTDDRADLVRRCRDDLLGQHQGQRVALLIDDAHLLDDLSTLLVAQLAQSEDAFVIASVDGEAAGTDFFVSLWKNGRLERLDVEPLASEQIEELASEVLDGPVDWATVRQLAEASGGKPLFLRELILGARDQNVLRTDLGIWRLVGPLPTSRRLTELVEARLADLEPEERRLMEVIAFGEPLAVDDMSDVDAAVLQDLERRSMILSEDQHGRLVVRLAHHVYGQVLRETLPRLRVREILRYLADTVEAAGLRGPDDLLRVASWRLDGGGSRADVMLEAARHARERYDFVLALRLARRSVHLAPTFEGRLLAAQLSATLGAREQAEAELAELATSATTDEQHARVALSRMDNLVFSLGHIDLGLQLAAEAEEAIVDQDWKDELAAKRASVLAGTSGPAAAADVAVPLLQRARGRALVWASMVSAYALGRLGRAEQALAATVQGRAAHLGLPEPFDWPAWRHAFFEAEALGHLGRFDESHAKSLELYRHAVDDGSVDGQAWFAWQLAMHVPARGFADSAVYYGRLAVALSRELGRPLLEQFALNELAVALAIAGQADQARVALGEVRELGLPETRYYPVERLHAEAWTAFAEGHVTVAAELFRNAAEVAQQTGDAVGEVDALHALARIGELDGVRPRLDDLAAGSDGLLAPARARHVAAVAARDAPSLDDVAASFREMGAHLLAAEAWARAAREWRRQGRARDAAASERRALAEMGACENPRGTAALSSSSTARLTPAELRTAMLARGGRTSREIAEELDVSVRTIQNHLQHVYEKLGIRSRSELGRALVDHEAH